MSPLSNEESKSKPVPASEPASEPASASDSASASEPASECEPPVIGFVHNVNNAGAKLDSVLRQWQSALHDGDGVYALCVGSSATSDTAGISAAGADGASRRLTPAIDAEALVLGYPVSAKTVPSSPAGVVSPVVISRAMLDLVPCRIKVFDCGAFHPPQVAHVNVGGAPAECVQYGHAMEQDLVERLFQRGCAIGKELAQTEKFLVIGECVPAGTTTALAVLTALGFPAASMVSSSMPNADRELRNNLVSLGISQSGHSPEFFQENPLSAVAAVGDPMQAFVAGMAYEASRHIPVVLGGGTQMLTVYALMQAIQKQDLPEEHSIAVVTTKWVAFDPFAGAGKLAQLLQAPFAASCPNFHLSRHPGLRAYEEGNVKEGVGAGAMMAAAFLTGNSETRILTTIDAWYDRMVGVAGV